MSAASRHAAQPRSVDPAEGTAGRITAMTDSAFLAEMGWDAQLLVLAPPDGHPLVIRPVCRAEGCSTTATGRARICKSSHVEAASPPPASATMPSDCSQRRGDRIERRRPAA